MPITKKKISYNLNLESEYDKYSIKPSKRKSISDEIGNLVIDEILNYVANGNTPVSNGSYKRTLSKEYKTQTGKSFSDLRLEGDMLSNLKFVSTKKGIDIKITDSTEKKKAYNHNVGDTLPVRQFIPNDEEGEVFKRSITKKIKDVIRANQDED